VSTAIKMEPHNYVLERQVAQLSLTNPCIALHHDKRQNLKTVTRP